MSIIDVVDEGVIDAPPDIVCKAYLDEYAGLTHWHLPFSEMRHREGSPIGGENMITDITLHTRIGTESKFTTKITKVEEGKSIHIDYIGGDFIGTGVFTFTPFDGKTRISYRWTVRPTKLSHNILNIISPLARRHHSMVVQHGYKSLNEFLNKN